MQKKKHNYNAAREKHSHAHVPGTVLAMVTCFEDGEIERSCEPLVHKTFTLLTTHSTQKKEVKSSGKECDACDAGEVERGVCGCRGRG